VFLSVFGFFFTVGTAKTAQALKKTRLTPCRYRSDVHPMKTMPILIALLLVGNAFGWECNVERPSELSVKLHPRPAVPGGIEMAEKAAKAQTPYVPTPDKPSSASSTSYSLITLPDGKTASVLTFH
jgi:hypothetical protein